ncbi:ribonuclease III [Kroppenstedtia pulmonis]|uniref:Ribonuclease 3 n=1 Tax=Kroppenstedtia pulmonis TaxID=1380685 RepID=A0A7D4BK55_9BACL|nr:ribonuclease III [Kroppenstedtia pulmonis]QKG84650.1 ribonuclease III [Kroppenstedtia pulmonis]
MNLTELGQKVGLTLHDKLLFQQAFTHTSYAHERKGERGQPDNERLEFLGDAVLELTVSEYLYERFPNMKEGDLTRMRARIVCEPSLATFAKELDFGRYVRLGKGEELTGGRTRPALLADVFEAFIGALYLEKGLGGVKHFLRSIIFARIDDRWLARATDAKSQLQEAVQQEHLGILEYQIVDVKGPAHDRKFVAEVWLAGHRLGTGTGRSKKEAEQRAASEGLKAFRKSKE